MSKAIIDKIKSMPVENILKILGIKITGRRVTCPSGRHEDRHPSCVVYEKNFYCFSCAWSGDIFDFFMQRDGLSFGEAVQFVAQGLGLEVSEPLIDEKNKPRNLKTMKVSTGKFCFIIKKSGTNSITEQLRQKGFLYHETKTFKVFDIPESLKRFILENPNVALLPNPDNENERLEAILLSSFLDVSIFDWSSCPVKNIEQLEPDMIAASLVKGVDLC